MTSRQGLLRWVRIFGLVSVVAALAVPAVGELASAATTPAIATPYTVTFSETGLPNGTSWSVHVTFVGCTCDGVRTTVSSTHSTLVIPVTNGTYNYNVLRVPGYFVNVSARGSFNVSGANVSAIPIVFHPVVVYPVSFQETGLPSGTMWIVRIQGNGLEQERLYEDQTRSSNGTWLNVSLPNGSYEYLVENVNGSFFLNHSSTGTFTVAGGPPPAIPVSFTSPPLFAVTFTETGLQNATNWSVRVNSVSGTPVHLTLSSTTTHVVFFLPSEPYVYRIGEVLGFRVNGSSAGVLTVAGAPLGIGVTYVQLAQGAFYPVVFEENGLANGTTWSVLVTATHTFGHSRQASQSSSSNSILFLLQNGSYRFQVRSLRGYVTSVGGSGTFDINGSAPSVRVVNFTVIPTYAVTFTETGLPNGTVWSVLVRSQSSGSTLWPVHVTKERNATTISFAVPNGTYCYRIYPVYGFVITAVPAEGTFSVSGGSPPVFNVVFTPRV